MPSLLIRKIQANAAAEHRRIGRGIAAERFIKSISYGQGGVDAREGWKPTPWRRIGMQPSGLNYARILNIDETEWNRRMQEQLAQQATEFPDLATRPT